MKSYTVSAIFIFLSISVSEGIFQNSMSNFPRLRSQYNRIRNPNESLHSSLEIDDDSGMEYCDDAISFTTSRTDCKYGYSFGTRIPGCICFKGLYRMILDDCFESDGLSESKVCTRPYDTQRESGAKIFTVQITQEINWDHTHVVCEKSEPSGSKIWSATPLHGKDKSVTVTLPSEEPDFYVVNGIPYIVDIGASKQAICVEEKWVSSFKQEKICRYFRNDNDAWRVEKAIDITIRNTKCPPNAKQMIPSECFPSQRDGSSECELRCDTALTIERNLTGRVKTEENQNSLAEGRIAVQKIPPYVRYDNLFLDRKMLQYLLVSNLQFLSPPVNLQPNRSYEIFDRLVAITNAFCPDAYVYSDWVNFNYNLFKVINSGNTNGKMLLYEEVITQPNFEWAKEILDTCLGTATSNPVVLTPEPYDNEFNETDACIGDRLVAWGYCPDGQCDILHAKRIKPHRSKTSGILAGKHYVPEMAWNVLDITQAICFREFNSSYRMFHIVQQAIEALFTEKILNLWEYPTYNDPASHVKAQLLGKEADIEMHNLEICTGSAYDIFNSAHSKKYGGKATPIVRLKRPEAEPYFRRRKRAAPRSISGGVDAYCLQRSRDWKYPDSCFKS